MFIFSPFLVYIFISMPELFIVGFVGFIAGSTVAVLPWSLFTDLCLERGWILLLLHCLVTCGFLGNLSIRLLSADFFVFL